MVERSLEMIIGIMGILKAGGAYLPIDPEYPRYRIKYILEDSNTKILLTQSWLLDGIDHFVEDIILLDNDNLYSGDNSSLGRISNSDNLAYVIYTSGSTGKPKGVLIEHKALNNFLSTIYNKFNKDFNEKDKCLSLTNICFDVSVGEIFLPLSYGSTLVLYDEKIIDINKLAETIKESEITFAYIPPTILTEVNNLLKEDEELTLDKMLVGVEPINDYVLEEYKNLNSYMQIVNGYGPTEATICATMYQYGSKVPEGKAVPIGKPLSNIEIYILNQNNNIVPIGIAGELCISGDGLARGYLNKEELTAEKFIENPFIEGKRMYKTGDLARWLPDGNIEFIGRMDHQVKIRGFRVELGEIENKLLNNPYIKEAVVLAKEEISGNKYLCGYIVAEKEMTVLELKKYLSDELPEYMIPSYFIQLDKLPLTSNGKIDRKALLQMEDIINTGTIFEEPTNPIEERLLEIWKEVLGVDRISINDNFFNIGGHSLKAIVLISKIKLNLKMEISLSDIFKFPTIKEIANMYTNLMNKETSVYDNRIVLLRLEPDSTKNIFLIHDGSGEVGGYVGLSNSLDAGFNIYGIQAGNLCKYSPVNIKIEELALNYIKQIQLVQKKGPYFIGGWSTGGIIAFEIVKQLEEMEENVKLLLIIDAYLSNLLTSSKNNFTADKERYNIETLFMNEELNMEVSKINDINKIWEITMEFLGSYSSDCSDIIDRIDSNMLAIVPDYGKNTIESLVYYINTIRTLDHAISLYIPSGKIRASTYFLKPKDEKYGTPKEWNKYTEQCVNVIEVSGDHFSTLKPPHILTIANEIKKMLDTHSI